MNEMSEVERLTALEDIKLRRELAAKLSSYKVPRRILRFGQAEWPTLSSGKLPLRRWGELAQARVVADQA